MPSQSISDHRGQLSYPYEIELTSDGLVWSTGDTGHRVPVRVWGRGYLKENRARWSVPSLSLTSICWQVPAHALEVFQT
jgi:hypothetical protein